MRNHLSTSLRRPPPNSLHLARINHQLHPLSYFNSINNYQRQEDIQDETWQYQSLWSSVRVAYDTIRGYETLARLPYRTRMRVSYLCELQLRGEVSSWTEPLYVDVTKPKPAYHTCSS